MSATNDYDRARLLLEDALANLAAAYQCQSIALTRMVQRVRTEQERDDINEITTAQVELKAALKRLAGFHPQRLEER